MNVRSDPDTHWTGMNEVGSVGVEVVECQKLQEVLFIASNLVPLV